MLKHLLLASTITVALGIGLSAAAATPGPTPAPAGQEDDTSGVRVHLEGCLLPDKPIPGARPGYVPADPNATYVLTEPKIIAGPDDAVDGDGELKVKHDTPTQLRDLIGKRVGVTGHVEKADLRVISIREIVGGCRRALAARS